MAYDANNSKFSGNYRYTRKAHGTVRFEGTVLKCSGVRLKYNSLIEK